MTTTAAAPSIRERLTAELFDIYGQSDTHRTNAMIDRVVHAIHPEIAAALVTEFAEWVAAFEATPEGARDVTMNEITRRARQALGLSSDFHVEAGSTNATGMVPFEPSEAVQVAYRAAGVGDLVRFAQFVVAMDDVDSTSVGGKYRQVTGLRDLIVLAKDALSPAF